jgi:hypothetical protein
MIADDPSDSSNSQVTSSYYGFAVGEGQGQEDFWGRWPGGAAALPRAPAAGINPSG